LSKLRICLKTEFGMNEFIIIIIIITANELSLCGSSPYTNTDKEIRINIHKLKNTKTQYKQYKTQYIQVHILPKHTHNFKTPSHYKTS